MRHRNDGTIVLALVGVLAIMVTGLVVAEVLAATTNSQWEIGPNVATLLATLGGAIAGAAAGFVTGGRTEPAPTVTVGGAGVVAAGDDESDDGDMDGHGDFDPEPDFTYEAEDHDGEYAAYEEVDLDSEPDDGSTSDAEDIEDEEGADAK